MKQMKFAILVCGLMGLATLFIPINGNIPVTEAIKHPIDLLQFLIIFLLPTAAAGLAIAKSPAQPWQAALALGGFGFGFVKLKLWNVFKDLGGILDMPGGISPKLALFGILIGLVVSLIALIKPEETA